MRHLALLCALALLMSGCTPPQTQTTPQPAAAEAAPQAGEPGGTTFYGVPTPGRSIAFVIDRSGSMTDVMMYAKYELNRSISQLRPADHFYVVFFSAHAVQPLPAGKLVPASDENKQAAAKFIDGIVPMGKNDPAGGFRLAFAQKPDVIYLLTDGELDQSVIKLVKDLNADSRTKVNTVCLSFGIHDGGEVLKQIAEQNGGVYKNADLETLGE